MEFITVPSKRVSSSRRRSSAAKRIQTLVRGKQTRRKQAAKKLATRRIQSRVRGKQTRKVINREKNTMLAVNDCSICFEPLTTDVRIALPCGHRFHKDCIEQSLASTRGKCPNCRTVVTNIEPRRLPIQLTQYELRYLELNTQIEQLEHQIEQVRQQIRDPNITTYQALINQTRAIEIERATDTIYNECDSQLRDYIRNQSDAGNEEYEYENNPEYQSLENLFAYAYHISVEAGELLDDTYTLVQSL